MNDQPLTEAAVELAGALREFGFDAALAAGLANVVDDLGDLRARRLLAERIQPLRVFVWFEALFRELAGDDVGETAVEAARRLHVHPRELRRCRQRIRAALGQPCPLV